MAKRILSFALSLALLLTCVGGLTLVAGADTLDNKWIIYVPGEEDDGGRAFDPAANAANMVIEVKDAGTEIPADVLQKSLSLSIDITLDAVAAAAFNAGNAGAVELTNTNESDYAEVAWVLQCVTWQEGRNQVMLPLAEAIAYAGNPNNTEHPPMDFDVHKTINHFRIYTTPNDGKPTAACTVTLNEIALVYTGEAGLAFGVEDTYLQLNKPLSAAPNTIEASVKTTDHWPITAEINYAKTSQTPSDYATAGTGTVSETEAAAGGPAAGTAYQSSTITAGGRFGFVSTFKQNINIPKVYGKDDLALTFWVYVSRDIGTLKTGQIELSSTDNIDDGIFWDPQSITVKQGWNFIMLPFKGKTQPTGKVFDPNVINRFRWYTTSSQTFTEGIEIRVAELQIKALPKDESDAGLLTVMPASKFKNTTQAVTTGNETGNPPANMTYYSYTFVGSGAQWDTVTNTFTAPDLSAYAEEDLALSFWFYVDDAAAFNATGKGLGQLELCSGGNFDKEEYEWTMKAKTTLQNGWNKIVLPLSSRSSINGGGLKYQEMDYARWYWVGYELTSEVTIGIADMELISIKEDDAPTGGMMIFSNTGSTDENPTALLITDERKPAVVWGDKQYTFDYDLPQNVWVDLAVVRDTAEAEFIFYADGVEKDRVAMDAAAADTAPTVKHSIGADAVGKNNFYGMIADVRAWSDARTAAEIAANRVSKVATRGNGLDATTEGLIGSWFMIGDITETDKALVDTSAARNYAEFRGTAITPCTHANEEVRGKVEETCKAGGYTGDTWCADCGVFLAAGTPTSPLTDHPQDKLEVRDAKPNSCATPGYTGDTWCKLCETKVSDGEPIPATGHQNTTLINQRAGDCSTEGYSGDVRCLVCSTVVTPGSSTGYNKSVHVGETELRGAKAATCKEAGYTGDTHCKACGDKVKTGEATDKLTTHTWDAGVVTKEPTATEPGEKTYTCTVCGNPKTEPIPAGGEPEKTAKLGDVNGDGEVTSTDARMVLQYSVKKIAADKLDLSVADVDGNGEYTSTDARLILQYSVNKISVFPVENK